MSEAARKRAALAAIGQDLLDVSRDAGERRGAALLAPLPARPKACFVDLAATPDWLRLPRTEQRKIAHRAALLAIGPAIDASIDGDWLGDLADLGGEATLDWAIGLAGDVPGGGLGAVPVSRIEPIGFALMRAALPAALAVYLDWGPDDAESVPGPLAQFCVRHAVEHSA